MCSRSRGRGALLTTPCFLGQERPDGGTWPEDDPARVAAFNGLLYQVAAARPGQVEMVDFASLVCPGGSYTSAIGGTPLRPDGVHIDSGAGPLLAQPLLSQFAAVGTVRRDSLPRPRVPSRRPAVPSYPSPLSRGGQPVCPVSAPMSERPRTCAARERPTG